MLRQCYIFVPYMESLPLAHVHVSSINEAPKIGHCIECYIKNQPCAVAVAVTFMFEFAVLHFNTVLLVLNGTKINFIVLLTRTFR